MMFSNDVRNHLGQLPEEWLMVGLVDVVTEPSKGKPMSSRFGYGRWALPCGRACLVI